MCLEFYDYASFITDVYSGTGTLDAKMRDDLIFHNPNHLVGLEEI